MNLEWIAILAGMFGGALFLLGLYLLAVKKAAQLRERALVIYARCLLFLALLHGLGLVLVTGSVLLCVPMFFGQIPATDRDGMEWLLCAGVVFVFLGGVGLLFTRRFGEAARATS